MIILGFVMSSSFNKTIIRNIIFFLLLLFKLQILGEEWYLGWWSSGQHVVLNKLSGLCFELSLLRIHICSFSPEL